MAYRAGGYLPAGLGAWAGAVDGALGEQLDRLERYVETGSPVSPPGAAASGGPG